MLCEDRLRSRWKPVCARECMSKPALPAASPTVNCTRDCSEGELARRIMLWQEGMPLQAKWQLCIAKQSEASMGFL